MGEVSFSNPLLSSQRHVSKIATIFGRCCFASASRSPKWSVCAWLKKITSSLDTLRSDGGHAGFVATHGSMIATCPDGVVSENVLCPKYVIRLPFKSSIDAPPFFRFVLNRSATFPARLPIHLPPAARGSPLHTAPGPSHQ